MGPELDGHEQVYSYGSVTMNSGKDLLMDRQLLLNIRDRRTLWAFFLVVAIAAWTGPTPIAILAVLLVWRYIERQPNIEPFQ